MTTSPAAASTCSTSPGRVAVGIPVVHDREDVKCTGWHAAVSAEVRPGHTVVVAAIGADAVLECVGTHESVVQAPTSARPGGMVGWVGWVGVPHVTEIPQEHMFWENVGLRGGPAPVRAYLPDLLQQVLDGRIEPGKVFDLTLPIDQVADAYAAMDERGSIKTLLRP